MKKKILETLKNNQGAYVSGEELSHRIGVTRTAIWKHVQQLRAEGYKIESVSRKGYRLIKEPDTLDADILEIERKQKKFGHTVKYYDSIDSTNNVAKKLAAEGAIEGTVVIADEQIGGRGRLGRAWISLKGTGIWMSIILTPPIAPMDATKITQVAAAAVTLAIRNTTGCEAKIKWPNDIIIQRKKVCGILTEMSAELNSVNYIIVGIGINVNSDKKDFPQEVQQIATSIKQCTKKKVSRKKIVINILHEFEKLYLDFIQSGNIYKSIQICKKYSVTLGNPVKIIYKDKEVLGEALDLTDDGELVIKNHRGDIEKIISGEVSVRGITDYV